MVRKGQLTEEDERGVVRLLVRRLAGVLALAQHEGVRQRGPARRDVHGAAAGEVERREVVQPAVGVPRPARDGAVDNGGPQEREDERGHDAAALEGAADDDLHGARAEEQLVQAEDDLGQQRGAGRGRDLHVPQPEVGQVADEGVRRARVRQRVAPEHPLEGRDGHDHEGLEEEGQRGLAAREAAVEQADARDDHEDQARADHQPHVVEFEPGVDGVDVDGGGVAALGVGGVILRLDGL